MAPTSRPRAHLAKMALFSALTCLSPRAFAAPYYYAERIAKEATDALAVTLVDMCLPALGASAVKAEGECLNNRCNWTAEFENQVSPTTTIFLAPDFEFALPARLQPQSPAAAPATVYSPSSRTSVQLVVNSWSAPKYRNSSRTCMAEMSALLRPTLSASASSSVASSPQHQSPDPVASKVVPELEFGQVEVRIPPSIGPDSDIVVTLTFTPSIALRLVPPRSELDLKSIIRRLDRESSRQLARLSSSAASSNVSFTQWAMPTVSPGESGLQQLTVSLSTRDGVATSITAATQRLVGHDKSVWAWVFRANDVEEASFHFHFEDNNQADTSRRTRYVETVAVRLNRPLARRFASFVVDHWQWIAGTLVVPLVGWGWKHALGKNARPVRRHVSLRRRRLTRSSSGAAE
jgi:hypothetical protein